MVKVPVVNGFSVDKNPTPTPYMNINTPESAFNSVIGLDKVADGLMVDMYALKEIRNKQNDALAMEKGTEYNQEVLNTLYDTQNGLFAKSGKAYLDNVDSSLDRLKQKGNQLLNGLAPDQRAVVGRTINNVYTNAQAKVVQNATREQEIYRKNILDDLMNTQTQLAVANRNDAKSVMVNVGNINASIAATYGDSIDEATLKNIQQKATSDLLENVLSARIADKNPYSKDFFDMYKSQIDPSKHPQLIQEIDRLDTDIQSRLFADNCFNLGLDEETAFNQAIELDKKYSTDSYSAKVTSLYNKQRSIEKQAYEDKKDEFWNTFATNPDIDSIPSWLKGEDRVTAKNYALKGAQADDNTYVNLYEMSITNADNFSRINLNDYRDRLTNEQYKNFAKRQQDIRMHGYSSLTPDDSRVIEVANALGLRKSPDRKEAIASYTQSIVNAEEARLGRKLKEDEQNKFFEYLGYKGGKETTFRTIEQYGGRADFYKGIANDVTYFSKVHGRMPDSKEFNDMVYSRGVSALQKQNEQTYKNVRAKANETKALTYFADSVVPQLGKKLGTNLQVTSRYRPAASQKYKSHHTEGRALDISMSEHSVLKRKQIANEILKNPLVERIGTSDPAILSIYAKNPKVVDESRFDEQNGTNHKNHIHVTLKNDSSQQSNNRVLIVDSNGNRFTVPQSQLSEAIRHGYRKI